MSARPGYPFSALVGQEKMRLALLLVAIRPQVGGVLLRGEKGTAKSTAARALAHLLPSGALRTLPLGATEDRLAGGLDLERSLAAGRPVLAPGLLADVDEGVLYVDEVNLLDDHLVDLVLDVAASGVNVIEREGLSFSHPSRFALVGSMNPEEGGVRPELLDRFGLCVDVVAEQDVELRTELMRRRLQYDADPAGFAALWRSQEEQLRERLARAREAAGEVRLPRDLADAIAGITMQANVAGMRADLALAEAARAHAAWHGRDAVTVADLAAVSELVLTHRRRDAAPPPPAPPQQRDDDEQQPDEQHPDEQPEDDRRNDPSDRPEGGDRPDDQAGPEPQQEQDGPAAEDDSSGPRPLTGPDGDTDPDLQPAPDDGPVPPADQTLPLSPAGEPFRVRRLEPVEDRRARTGSGRRLRTRSADRRGRYVRSRPAADASDLALDATVRAAAVHQRTRRERWQEQRDTAPPAVLVTADDYRTKVRERRVGSFILFVVDASGSMGARGRMMASKGAVLSLLLDAYQKRDRVAMVTFRRDGADVLLPPTASIDQASHLLGELPVGGRTPLPSALVAAHRLLEQVLTREPTLRPLVVLVSDGRANQALPGTESESAWQQSLRLAGRLAQDERVRWVVVDTEAPGGVTLHLPEQLARALGAECHAIDDLRADDLVGLVKGHHQ